MAGEGGGWQEACMLVYAMCSSPAPPVTGGEAHGGRDSPVRASERACPQKANSPVSSVPAQLVLPALAQLNNRMLLLTWELLYSH